jgi:hypothetical protein
MLTLGLRHQAWTDIAKSANKRIVMRAKTFTGPERIEVRTQAMEWCAAHQASKQISSSAAIPRKIRASGRLRFDTKKELVPLKEVGRAQCLIAE